MDGSSAQGLLLVFLNKNLLVKRTNVHKVQPCSQFSVALTGALLA